MEFTGEETKTRNYYPLPDNVISIDVYVQKKYISRRRNVVASEEDKDVIRIIIVE